MKKKASHVYGPVPSRRFGLSLGVDLLPYKTCSLDCIYCQLGRSKTLTIQRNDFYPVDKILADVTHALETGPKPDVITLAGSGEPTLYKSLAELVKKLKKISDAPLMLLTNASLFYDPEVADAIQAIDILSPSLDACDEPTFERINRPEKTLHFDTVLTGLRTVLAHHPGEIHLEVMLVRGINDTDDQIEGMAKLLQSIRAHTIDINSPVRPPAYPGTLVCTADTLQKAQAAFGPRAKIIAGYKSDPEKTVARPPEEQKILDLLARRPCTVKDLHEALGCHPNELMQMLEHAERDRKIARQLIEGELYYVKSNKH